MTEESSVLRACVEHFTFHDEAGPVLTGLELALRRGSITALLGASGSGKTTLGRLLGGWSRPGNSGLLSGVLEVAGQILHFEGTDDDPAINAAEWARHVGYVPQDSTTVLSMVRATVGEELAFGLENRGVSPAAMRESVQHVAGRLGLTHLLEHSPTTLSGGELRKLAIGCVVIMNPEILILDEPAASLDAEAAAGLVTLMRDLAGRGTAVLILSQCVDALVRAAGHWFLLQEGSLSAGGIMAELPDFTALAAAGLVVSADCGGVGSTPATDLPVDAQLMPDGSVHRASPPDLGGSKFPAAQLADVQFAFGPVARQRRPLRRRNAQSAVPPNTVLRGVNLSLQAGEVIAITGPNGAGKSTLLRHFNGLLQPDSGSVLIEGKDIAGQATGMVAAAVGLLFQQPRDQLFERTAQREVAFGLSGSAGTIAAATTHALDVVGLSGASSRHPAELPASQQRLLALATVLARRPAILLLDEPTVALDGHGRRFLVRAIHVAAAAGAAVVLVTHDVDFAAEAAHKTLVLSDGILVPAEP